MLIWFATLGAIGLLWFVLVALFSPGIKYRLRERVPTGTPEFVRTLSAIGQSTLHLGNRVEVLTDGPTFYPAMLDAIRGAQHSINLECYIFQPGHIGDQFVDAMIERAEAGVTVSVVGDAIGSLWLFWSRAVRRMRKAGCRVHNYQALRWYSIARLNNRTHRELLIVDGRIAFMGGAGIADWWGLAHKGRPHWRDTMIRIHGPIVASIQGAFVENWVESCGEILTGPAYFPQPYAAADTAALVLKSSPADRATISRIAFQALIEGARTHLRINTPYFIPDRQMRRALTAAARRGVVVEIVLPGPSTDQRWVRLASRRWFGHLLKCGVRLFEYRPSMMHAKVMIVDDAWSVLGTTNMDNRSFELNDEVNLLMLDPFVSARLIEDFERDLARSDQITMETWERRPWWERVLDPIVWILERQQ